MNRGHPRALSLVELIIALSLVGLIIIFLFGLFPSTGLLTRQSEQQLAATEYAGEILARLDSMSFETLKAGAGTLTTTAPGILGEHLTEKVLSDKTVLSPEVSLRSVPPAEHLVQSVVVIRWQTRRRAQEYRVVRNFSSVNR